MECTQRLECTQELYETHTEKTCPEQIGFLGICGAKHPVLKGPNKIGRDPQTCSIILNLNSVSRQHAVINVLSSKEFMLMDLDSANKTKLQNKTLQPYIPHPIRDGDTVQFGDIFGIFRLLEEDDALPMTQAIDIPETPAVACRHVTKLHKVPTTVIPESPDVSDRDDSFITPSQPVGGRSRLSSSSFIKLNNNKVQTQQGSSPKTYSNRKSSKQSPASSFIDNPNTSLNESFISLKCDKNLIEDIHEADTQAPNPIANESTDSIYTADTQIPPERAVSPSIYSLDTQVPSTEHLPQVRKIDGQHEMQLDIYAANKENNRDIFNAETQPFGYDKDLIENVNRNKANLTNKTVADCSFSKESKDKLNISEEELLFEEVDGELFEDFNSQNILQDEVPLKENVNEQSRGAGSPILSKVVVSDDTTDCEDKEVDMMLTQKIPELPSEGNKQHTKIQGENDPKPSKRTARIKSDSSTDCEDIDIAPTQVVLALPSTKDIVEEKTVEENRKTKPSKRINRIQSDSSTDCEDIDFLPTQKIPEKKDNKDDDATDCEDDVSEIKPNKPPTPDVSQDDIATQIIDLDYYKPDQQALEDMPTQIIDICEVPTNSKTVALEDQLTQVIDEVAPENIKKAKKIFDEIVSPFKIPLQSPIRVKSKEIPKVISKDATEKNKSIDVEDNYYNATQDLYEDLCSQRENSADGSAAAPRADDEVVPCSVENYKVKDKFANIERDLSPAKDQDVLDDKDATVGDKVAKLSKMPSDSSDLECTPKKVKKFIFTDSDLPDSQEIKTSMMSHARSTVTESSSESEPENCSEEITPFLNRRKKTKAVPKVDLSKMFEKLPERVITRQRKPTFKLLSNEVSKNNSTILKPSYLTEQEDQIDGDIITENIKRLKKFGKGKTNKDTKNEESLKDDKKDSSSRKKSNVKSKEPKEKIKVKIEKPKRKDTKSKTESSGRKSAELDKNIAKDSLDSTSVDKPPTRRTRSRKNENDSQNSEKNLENLKNEPDNKRKRTNKKQEKERSVSPEMEVRRSKRQQKAKEKDDTMKAPVPVPKKSAHEQSTVYNISSSSSESPKSLKRSLVEDSDVPSPKRTRSHNTNSICNSINNSSLRATPARAMKTQHVLLTAFPSAEVKQKLEKLGAVIVTDVLECSVVLTMQIKRTFKLLCAAGLGRPIVGPAWVQACADANLIVDPWLYIVKDEQAEKRFQFDLYKTLSGKRNFLKGYNVSSTPSVQPNAAEMKLIVECSGGAWKEGGPNWVCVTCAADRALWGGLRARGAALVCTEFILGGVLRQRLDVAGNAFP
ncbi:hypothetical protein PYW07_012113 [Mythimna separata]|uniref:Mediator of DNA damage checkpoint protein 1 n=1 Tax=Mythimna separata TaxID=271217 RepID=A0AAD7YMQ5_MYTSE|nr:hypothetical protein PYW07_012113 [Mythimna separata]